MYNNYYYCENMLHASNLYIYNTVYMTINNKVLKDNTCRCKLMCIIFVITIFVILCMMAIFTALALHNNECIFMTFYVSSPGEHFRVTETHEQSVP